MAELIGSTGRVVNVSDAVTQGLLRSILSEQIQIKEQKSKDKSESTNKLEKLLAKVTSIVEDLVDTVKQVEKHKKKDADRDKKTESKLQKTIIENTDALDKLKSPIDALKKSLDKIDLKGKGAGVANMGNVLAPLIKGFQESGQVLEGKVKKLFSKLPEFPKFKFNLEMPFKKWFEKPWTEKLLSVKGVIDKVFDKSNKILGGISNKIKSWGTGIVGWFKGLDFSGDIAEFKKNWMAWSSGLAGINWNGLFKSIGGDNLSKYSSAVSNAISSFATNIKNGAMAFLEPFQEAGKFFKSVAVNIKDGAMAFINPIIEGGKVIGNWVGKQFSDILSPIGRGIKGSWDAFKNIGNNTPLTGVAATEVSTEDMPLYESIKKSLAQERKDGTKQSKDLCKCICRCIQKIMGKLPDKKATKRTDDQTVKIKELTAKAIESMQKDTEKAEKKAANELKKKKSDDAKIAAGSGLIARSVGEFARLITTDSPFEAILIRTGRLVTNFTSGVASFIPVIGGGLSKIIEGSLTQFLDVFAIKFREEIDYFQGLRQTAFTGQGITRGGGQLGLDQIVSGNNEQQAQLNSYEVGLREVLATNQNITTVQRTQLNNLRRGIKEARTLNRVTTTGLNTASLLGSNAESTAEYFADMHQNLQMSANDIDRVASGLREVSRQTGITGDRLIGIAKNSEQFATNMRNAGTLTASAARNITSVLAQSSLTGTTQAAQRILGVLSGNLLAGDTDQQTTNLLLQSARSERARSAVLTGTALQDRGVVREIAQGMEAVIRQLTGGRDISDLSPQQRAAADATSRRAYNIGIQELQLAARNLLEGSRSFTERLASLQRLAPSVRDERRRTLEFDQLSEYINQFGNLLNTTDNLDQAFNNFNRDIRRTDSDFNETMRALNINMGSGQFNQAQLQQVLGRASENLNQRLSAANIRESITPESIAAALAEGPNRADRLRDLIQRFSDLNKQAEAARQANQDPISRISRSVIAIEAMLRQALNSGIGTLGVLTDKLLSEMANAPWLQEGINQIMSGDFSGFGRIFNGFTDAFSNFSSQTAPRLMQEIANTPGLNEFARSLMSGAVSLTSGITTSVTAIINSINSVATAINSLITQLTPLTSAITGLVSVANNILSWISGGGNNNPTWQSDVAAMAAGAAVGARFFGPLGGVVGTLTVGLMRLYDATNALAAAQTNSTNLNTNYANGIERLIRNNAELLRQGIENNLRGLSSNELINNFQDGLSMIANTTRRIAAREEIDNNQGIPGTRSLGDYLAADAYNRRNNTPTNLAAEHILQNINQFPAIQRYLQNSRDPNSSPLSQIQTILDSSIDRERASLNLLQTTQQQAQEVLQSIVASTPLMGNVTDQQRTAASLRLGQLRSQTGTLNAEQYLGPAYRNWLSSTLGLDQNTINSLSPEDITRLYNTMRNIASSNPLANTDVNANTADNVGFANSQNWQAFIQEAEARAQAIQQIRDLAPVLRNTLSPEVFAQQVAPYLAPSQDRTAAYNRISEMFRNRYGISLPPIPTGNAPGNMPQTPPVATAPATSAVATAPKTATEDQVRDKVEGTTIATQIDSPALRALADEGSEQNAQLARTNELLAQMLTAMEKMSGFLAPSNVAGQKKPRRINNDLIIDKSKEEFLDSSWGNGEFLQSAPVDIIPGD